MKILRTVVIAFVAILGILIGVSFLLPRQVHVERTATVDAPASAVYAVVNNLETWKDWTAWGPDRDPTIEYQYSEPKSGKDAWFSWKSQEMGAGKLTITKSDPASGIDYEMRFDDYGTTSSGGVKLVAKGDKTEVTWSFDGDMGNSPPMRYMGLMMDRMLGPDFEKGLTGLEKQAAKPTADATK